MKIESLSEDYMEIIKTETFSHAEARGDKSKILNDWWLSLIFFFDRVFYQGRKDTLSARYEKATIETLNEFLGKDNQKKLDKLRLLNAQDCLDYTNEKSIELKEKLEKRSAGKERDREMVIDTLRFVAQNLEKTDYSLIKYSINRIKKHETEELFNELDNIRQIGDKTASVFLRDVVAVYDLTEELETSDYIFLQPVDTWVNQVSKKLKLAPERVSIKQLKEIIVKKCLDNSISPIKFNQGLWYLGARSLDVIFKWFDNE